MYDFTDEQGKWHYESFTADTKKETEYLAAEFALNKKERKTEGKDITFGEAVDNIFKVVLLDYLHAL